MTNEEAIKCLECDFYNMECCTEEECKCDEAITMAIEALEKTEHKCENCDHRRNRDYDMYWCNERWTWVDDDMHCSDWSEEE